MHTKRPDICFWQASALQLIKCDCLKTLMSSWPYPIARTYRTVCWYHLVRSEILQKHALLTLNYAPGLLLQNFLYLIEKCDHYHLTYSVISTVYSNFFSFIFKSKQGKGGTSKTTTVGGNNKEDIIKYHLKFALTDLKTDCRKRCVNSVFVNFA